MDKISVNSRIIVITGAESTGKTQLAQQLAAHYQCPWIPEYARDYIGSLDRRYYFSDVEKIAKHQAKEYELSKGSGNRFVFMDTWLIITKVWFEVVFKKKPGWVDQFIRQSFIDLFLVCDTDIEWIPDPLRENGGEMRIRLHKEYLNNISFYGFNHSIISGIGDIRLLNAIEAIEKHFNSQK